MKWKRDRTAEPEPAPDLELDGWTLTTPVGEDGATFDLHGWSSGVGEAETLRYVYALRDGLRAAGYEPELSLTRRTRVVES